MQARLIAFYLPQYHPIPENDLWWGKGFTEWTNVTRAKPLFKGHYQPRLPADLGFYDLRVPEVREAQAELARSAGIEGFCYYHYWFAGKRLIERPFTEVVASGRPDFPFCLCWANQTWSGIWHGEPGRVLIEQTYPGEEDNRLHFLALRDAFHDRRYLRVRGRPIFVVYKPAELLKVADFILQWQQLAIEDGLPGLHFVAHLDPAGLPWDYKARGFDSSVVVSTLHPFRISGSPLERGNASLYARHLGELARLRSMQKGAAAQLRHRAWRAYQRRLNRFSNVRLYSYALPFLLWGCSLEHDVYPCVTPNWDNTPRSGLRGYVLDKSTPELFRMHLRDALELVKSRAHEDQIVFIKSWNEWAEGNHLEPDQQFGHGYLKVISEEIAPVEHGTTIKMAHYA